uniref:Uncharacterized protein n=1 Tax=Chromera velia CCMP2878 TaxID=1169474 RepID=A0A0G4F2F6_9ALVE|eukprot:Cvel_2633.t1-p1 / transcript=Cvel_2633.t1 / gene=Cvel_2633 / organism=Chromera_velia_CCMP2878 / gene_product=hypothetical protein / transcript_product=hypothetical protein / location=Cvel_scaffold104:67401-72278(+) / protein_length=346 / sequence_SO=supercontig / SO=protein_coding / is_pseudo=false
MDGVVPDMSMSSVRSSLTARTGKPPPAALSKEMLYRFHERLTLSVLEDMWFDIKQLLIKDPSADGKDGPNARAERDQARAFVKEALRGPDNVRKEPLVTAEQEREREKEKEREREKEKERERERERENGGRSKSRQPTAAGRRTGPAGASASASASSKLPAAEPGGPSSQSRAVSRMSKHPKDHSGAPPPTAASGKRTAPPTRGGSGGVPSGKAASRPPAASPMPLGKAFASAEGKKTGQGTAAALQAALHSQTPSAPLEQNLSTAQSLTQTQEGETAGDGHGGDLKDIKEKEKEGEKEKENHEGGGQRPGTPQSVHTETAAGKERTDPGGAKGERGRFRRSSGGL